MTNRLKRKISLALLSTSLLLMLLFSSASFSFVGVAAATGGQLPAPTVGLNNNNQTDFSVFVLEGPEGVFASTWSGLRTIMTNPGNTSQHYLNEGFQGNVQGNVTPTWTAVLEYNLHSQVGSSPVVYINSTYGTFPINLYNATSLVGKVGSVNYVNGMPTVTNNVTFNDIALPTYGHNVSSSVTFLVSQNLVFNNSTVATLRIGVYADLSNMKLYLSNGTEIPQDTKFSFNLVYSIDMSNFTQSNIAGHTDNLPPSNITRTSVYFAYNGTAGRQVSIANMNLGENYTEIQGSSSIANKTSAVYFSPSESPTWAVNCIQSFSNLTYGTTTAISTDPTITVYHLPISETNPTTTTGSSTQGPSTTGASSSSSTTTSSNSSSNNLMPYVAIAGVVVIVVVAAGAVFFTRRRKKPSS